MCVCVVRLIFLGEIKEARKKSNFLEKEKSAKSEIRTKKPKKKKNVFLAISLVLSTKLGLCSGVHKRIIRARLNFAAPNTNLVTHIISGVLRTG